MECGVVWCGLLQSLHCPLVTLLLSFIKIQYAICVLAKKDIKPALLNLVMKEQFSGASTEDDAAHLNNFVELCEMQKYKDVESDIIKLKLFPFSLREKTKDWLLSLTKNSIDSWTKCKDAFIGILSSC
jgi:hypothetical protein